MRSQRSQKNTILEILMFSCYFISEPIAVISFSQFEYRRMMKEFFLGEGKGAVLQIISWFLLFSLFPSEKGCVAGVCVEAGAFPRGAWERG